MSLLLRPPAELQSEPRRWSSCAPGPISRPPARPAADGRAQFGAVPLQLGPNTLLASATDAAGNRSPEVGVTVIRVRPSQAVIESIRAGMHQLERQLRAKAVW